MDLAVPIFINIMTSGWITNNLNWQLKVKNVDTGLYKVIPKSDKASLTEHKVSDINLKVHFHLYKGPKLVGRIGVAPCNNMGAVIGNTQDVFPLIQLGEQFQLDFCLANIHRWRYQIVASSFVLPDARAPGHGRPGP